MHRLKETRVTISFTLLILKSENVVLMRYGRMSVHTGGKSYFLSGMGSAYVPMYVNLYLPSGSRQCKHGSLRRSVSLFF